MGSRRPSPGSHDPEQEVEDEEEEEAAPQLPLSPLFPPPSPNPLASPHQSHQPPTTTILERFPGIFNECL